jgi:hypothetical protein
VVAADLVPRIMQRTNARRDFDSGNAPTDEAVHPARDRDVRPIFAAFVTRRL